MKLYEASWITRPSPLWSISEEEFCGIVGKALVRVAKSYGLHVIHYGLWEDDFCVLFCGVESLVPLLMKDLHAELRQLLGWRGLLFSGEPIVERYYPDEDGSPTPNPLQNLISEPPSRRKTPYTFAPKTQFLQDLATPRAGP